MNNIIVDSINQQTDYALLEKAQIEVVKKIAFILAEASEPIWYLGDGYGGEVKRIIEESFYNLGLYPEPTNIKSKSLRKSISAGTRREVYERDEYSCVKCDARKDLTIDHIVAVVNGGTNELSNLQTMCRSCNSSKGAR
jgi:hypothetical protein